MEKIETKLELSGFAWFEEDGSIMWALKEELEDVPPAKRPPGATPVIIEIYPVEEWFNKSRKEKEFLGDMASQINQFTSELKALQNSIRAKG
jgi:hypothetical protein